VRSAFGLPDAFLSRAAFLEGLAFLAGLRPGLLEGAAGSGVLLFAESFVLNVTNAGAPFRDLSSETYIHAWPKLALPEMPGHKCQNEDTSDTSLVPYLCDALSAANVPAVSRT
jgi:hypothetical protein